MSVYRLIRRLDPALLAIAHEGTNASCEPSDSPHRTEAEAPNAIWHAGHAALDIWIIGDDGQPRKPWLTIILDDYSTTLATSLAL
jgi:putative transposase